MADKDGYIFLRLILDTTDRVAQRSEVVGREGKAADEEDCIETTNCTAPILVLLFYKLAGAVTGNF